MKLVINLLLNKLLSVWSIVSKFWPLFWKLRLWTTPTILID